MIEWEKRELPISTQAQLLGLNRSGLYYQPVPPSAHEVALKHRIDEIYTAHPYYGYRRIAAQLHRDDLSVNQKTVARSMQEMGLAAIYPGPSLSQTRAAGRHLPVLAGERDGEDAQPYLGYRHHLHPLAQQLDVPGSDPGLVLTLRRELGTRSNHAAGLCHGGHAPRARTGSATDLQ